MLMTEPLGVVQFLVFSAFLYCEKRRREVWTVRLPKFVVHTSIKSINKFFYLYEASVRRY